MSMNFSCRGTSSRFLVSLLLVLGCGSASESWADSASATHRPFQQIVSDIDAAPLPNYTFKSQIDPRYRAQMTREFSGPLQRQVELYSELGKASPLYAAVSREKVCFYQAELALFGHDDALKALTDESQSKVAPDALAGKIGLMMFKWWGEPDADKQKQELGEFDELAKVRANADDDLLCIALLDVARYGAASDELAMAARDIVEKYLTSPKAIKYKEQPNKLGRPFVLRGESINKGVVSTTDWKGKVIIIDFWATWCPPCRAALPDLIKLYQENHDKGLEVLGISNDSEIDDLHKFLADNKDMAWPELFGPTPPNGWNRLSAPMGVEAIPTEFFIDRNGILRDITINDLQPEFVAKLLDESVKPAAAIPQASPAAPITPMTAKPAVEQPSQATTGQPAATPSDDSLANSLLTRANLLIDNGRSDLAVSRLNELIDKYPHTAAADKARQLLTQLKNGS
jgi:thiol-disulfide isomerase/thioredoxin